jgi:hypothetical protein
MIKLKTASLNTTKPQLNSILDWLEVPANFNIIKGAGGKGQPVVSGANISKTDGFKSLAEFMNERYN